MKSQGEQSKEDADLSQIFLKQHAVEEASRYYEALLGAEQFKTADSVADRLIAFNTIEHTFSTLIEHALRAGANDAARTLVERGMNTLPEKGQERLKLTAKKIPEKK